MKRLLILFIGIYLLPGIGLAQETLFGKSYAVVIGIDRYENSKWPDLTFSENDAKGMYDFLQSQNFETEQFYGSQATRPAILNYLKNLALKLQSKDRFLFFFSGHGETKKFGTRDYGYIIPVDGTDNLSTWIGMDELELIAEQMNAARHLLFLFDSCFGGMFNVKSSLSSPYSNDPNYIKKMASRISRQYITAGGMEEEVLAEGPDGHSYFTSYLLKALGGKGDINPDGYITASELYTYLLPAASNRRHTPSSGTFAGHEQGEFLFKTKSASVGQQKPGEPGTDSLLKGAPKLEPIEAEYVVISTARVREKPDITSPQIDSLKIGQKVWVAGQTKVSGNTWFLVELSQGKGYVYGNTLSKQGPTPKKERGVLSDQQISILKRERENQKENVKEIFKTRFPGKPIPELFAFPVFTLKLS